jgi:hypothetical protein
MTKPALAAKADSSASPNVAVASPQLREALAELRTTDPRLPATAKRPEARPQRQRNVGKKRTLRPFLFAARRSLFGWLGPTIW